MSEKKNSLGTPFTRVPNIVLTDFGLSPVEFMIYCAVLKHANKDTLKARPSHATLAKIVGVSARTIKRALVRLRALKLIHWAENSGGRGRSYEYTVLDATKAPKPELVDRPEKSKKGDTTAPLSDAKGGHHSTPLASERVTNETYKGGHHSTKKVDTTASKRVTPQTTELDVGDKMNEQDESNKTPKPPSDESSPYDHLTTSEKARRSKQLAQLVIAHQDATDDNERATIRQQIESITAEIRAEVWPTTGPVIDGRGGGAAGVDSDRPGDATGVRSDRDARGLLPDQTRHDMAGHERHASARGAD